MTGSDVMSTLGFSFAFLLLLSTNYYALARERTQWSFFVIHRLPQEDNLIGRSGDSKSHFWNLQCCHAETQRVWEKMIRKWCKNSHWNLYPKICSLFNSNESKLDVCERNLNDTAKRDEGGKSCLNINIGVLDYLFTCLRDSFMPESKKYFT